MSPEQIEGDEADARSDIFSFGAVLYEMFTGRRAFAGKSQASLLGSILKDEPSAVSQNQPAAPPALDYLVRTCLAKDPDARFQTARDLLLQLKWISEGGSAAGVPAPVVAHRRNRERTAWITAAVLGVLLFGAGAISVAHMREAAPVAEPIQFTISSPDNSLFSGQVPHFAVSPDGRYVAFVASQQSATVLWVRPIGSLVARPIAGTEQALYPFWSPDSRFIGFFANGKLRKVQLSGGPPVPLTDAPSGRGGTWNSDNVILFAPAPTSGIFRVPSAGGAATPVTTITPAQPNHRWPMFLPDGRHFLFFANTTGSMGEIKVGSLDAPGVVTVTTADSQGEYSAGHLLFVRGGTLMAQPFDLKTDQSTADPFPVSDRVGIDSTSHGGFSVSETGILLHAQGGSRPVAKLTWFDRAGKIAGTAGDPGEYFNVALSPDERRVAVSLQTGTPANRDIWVIDLARAGAPTRLTFDASQDGIPIWSPNGADIAFTSTRTGPWNMFMTPAAGGQETLVRASATTNYLTDWSHDGQFLVYGDVAASTGTDLFVLPITGDKKPALFLQTQFNEDHPVFSPDGKWIAYESNESGPVEVYVRPFPVAPGHYMVSRNGGAQPQWRNDGKELFFLSRDGTMMSVDVSSAPNFVAGVPQALFPTGVAFTGNRRQYSVTRDGKRFLVIVPEQRTSPTPLTVVVNWLAALQK